MSHWVSEKTLTIHDDSADMVKYLSSLSPQTSGLCYVFDRSDHVMLVTVQLRSEG